MASKVCGTSEQARGLKDMLHQSMQLVESGVDSMDRAVKNMKSGWDDDGSGEVDEILSAIKNALNKATEAAPQVERALENYAVFLDQR